MQGGLSAQWSVPGAERGVNTRRIVVALLCAFGAAASSGCGYRVVKRTDVTARRFAADSAAMISLSRQIETIRARCTADSLRMSAALAVAVAPARAAAAAVVPDSVVKARDTEIATLRDQLTRANAELDRIKRRLANPRP